MKKTPENLEQVTISIPENLMNLLKAVFPEPLRYLQTSLIHKLRGDFEDQRVFSESLKEKYNLERSFNSLGK